MVESPRVVRTVRKYTTDIVLVDVVGFSLLTDEEQYRTVAALTGSLKVLVEVASSQGFRASSDVVLGFIPTGDGFYIILSPALSGYGVFLAFSIRSAFLVAGRRGELAFQGIRCAVHSGSAMPFTDINGTQNFVGSGLNSCARLLPDKPEGRAPLEAFAGDVNFVVASEPALLAFDAAYPMAANQEWFMAIGWRQGEAFTITDKHGLSYSVSPIEASRYVAVRAPMPVDWRARAEVVSGSSQDGAL